MHTLRTVHAWRKSWLMLRVKLSICTVVGPLHTGQITLGVTYALSRSPLLIRNGLLLRAVGCLYPTLLMRLLELPLLARPRQGARPLQSGFTNSRFSKRAAASRVLVTAHECIADATKGKVLRPAGFAATARCSHLVRRRWQLAGRELALAQR